MADLTESANTVVERCLAIKAGEEVVVVADAATRTIGEALRERAAEAGADAVLALMDAREMHGNEPPRTIAGALLSSDVFIAPTSRSLSHTTARKRATDAGARGATLPGVTEDMLARTMAIDFEQMAARSRGAAAALSQGNAARVTCPRGTELTLDLTGRSGLPDDGDLTAPGAFGNLPCGEGFIAPLGGEGRIVAATLGPLGISPEPATLTVSNGRIVGGEGGLGAQFMELLDPYGDPGRNLAELGVGTNDRARLTGNVLEDEKILGTIHVAFGASAGIGGTVSVPIHLDVVVLEASLEVDGRPVLDGGRFVLEDA
jgi:leucyl aminopeptidase (aminopeptidase T)